MGEWALRLLVVLEEEEEEEVRESGYFDIPMWQNHVVSNNVGRVVGGGAGCWLLVHCWSFTSVQHLRSYQDGY